MSSHVQNKMLFRRHGGWRRDGRECTKHGFGGPGYGGYGRYGMYGGYRSHYNYATKWNPLPVPTGPPLITQRPQNPMALKPMVRPFFNPFNAPRRIVVPRDGLIQDSTQEFMKWVCILVIILLSFWASHGELI